MRVFMTRKSMGLAPASIVQEALDAEIAGGMLEQATYDALAERVRTLGIELRLVVVVKRERGVYLGSRQITIVFIVDPLGGPTIPEHVEHHLDDLHVGVIDPRPAALVEKNVSGRRRPVCPLEPRGRPTS